MENILLLAEEAETGTILILDSKSYLSYIH